MSQILAPTITFSDIPYNNKKADLYKSTHAGTKVLSDRVYIQKEKGEEEKKYDLVPLNSSQTRFERYTPKQCYISRQDADSRWKGWRQMCMGVIRYLVTFCIPPVPAPQTPECQTVHPLDQRRLSLLPPVLSNCSPCPLQNRPARHKLRISYLHTACWC